MRHIAEEQLALYAGGDLANAEAANVERHLQECPECRNSLAEFEAARGWLHQVAAVPPDAEIGALRWSVFRTLGRSDVSPERRRAVQWMPWAAAALTCASIALWFRTHLPLEPVRLQPEFRSQLSLLPAEPPSRPESQQTRISHTHDRVPRKPKVARRQPESQELSGSPEQPVIRVKTNDPNVVVLWLVSDAKPRQESRNE